MRAGGCMLSRERQQQSWVRSWPDTLEHLVEQLVRALKAPPA